MANTILQKSLTSAATVPHATNGLKIAELGVNTYDGRVYLGTKVGASGTAGGESTAATWVGAPILDEDAMGSDSAVKLATQQSIKAYVDSNAGSGDITGVTLSSDSGSAADTSANVDIAIVGGAGIDTSATGTTVTITGETSSVTNAGIVELATTAETNTGSDTARAVTPDGLNDWTGGAGAITKLGTIASGVWSGTALVAGALGADCVTAAKIGDNVINSEHYAAGSIDAEHMAANSIDSAAYVDGSIDVAHMSANSVDSAQYVDGSIDAAHLASDSVTEAKMAANSVDSQAYVDGSVDNVHMANSSITLGGTATSLGGTITGAHIAAALNSDLGGNFTIGNQSTDTCTISGDLTVAGTTTTTQSIAVGTADTIIFEGATADAYETTLTVVDPTAARTITLPNVTGTVVTTGDTATVTAAMLAANSVDSSELVDGSVDASHMSANSIDSASYVDGSIDVAHMSANSVDSAQYVDGSIDTAHIANDQITAALMADNSIDSAMYVDGSIDTAHFAAASVDAAAMGANSVDSSELVNGSVDLSHMSVNSVDSDQYVNGSVDNVHLANDGITIAGADTSLGGTISAATIASAIDSETMTLTNTTIDGGTYATS
jgi:hypothetical protein